MNLLGLDHALGGKARTVRFQSCQDMSIRLVTITITYLVIQYREVREAFDVEHILGELVQLSIAHGFRSVRVLEGRYFETLSRVEGEVTPLQTDRWA